MTAIHKTAHALASIGPGSCAGPQQYPSDREGKKAALLSAVEGIREAATGYAHEAESQATLPAVLVDALASSGLWTMKLPAELGGAEADPVTHIEVIEAASAIEPSVGWCLMVGATSIGLPGAFLPDAAIAEMFAGGRSPRAAMAAMPAGTAVPVSDGYRLSGRWPFASGVRHAQWITLGARVLRGVDRRPELRMMVLPTAAVQIHDNWDVAGLEGTGSCDVSVADYVVPEQFTWDTVDAKPLRGGPLYRLKRPGFFAYEHAAFALGVGRGALAEVTSLAQSTRRGFAPSASSLEARPTFQRALGQSDLRLRAARALVMDVNSQAWSMLADGQMPPPRLQVEMRSAAAFATEVAADVVTQAFRFAGGGAVYRTHRLQRFLRDINVAAQHLMASEMAYEAYGQFLLGMPDADPMR
jgi:alkylation response protein AidB-like acyl-CoA dehydrogenase